ncbi:MAG: hypothetical protein ACR2PM_15580 [Hyphomicrobiales bacterium]
MLNWLRKLFRREPPRIFLGALAVAPRTDFKRFFESTAVTSIFDITGLLNPEDLDGEIRKALTGLFTLPPISSRDPPKDSDLALDVIVPKFQSGEFIPVPVHRIIIPFFWRPKLTVAARLYVVETGQTLSTYSVTEKVGWKDYGKRLVSPYRMLDIEPMFTADDSKRLLYKACIKLLEKIKRDV